MSKRPPINEINESAARREFQPPVEPPSTIRLVNPIIARNKFGHMSAFAVMDVLTFERRSHSLVCDFEGQRREIFYANIAEIVAK